MDILEALTQYCDIREEIKDLHARIDKDQRYLEKLREEKTVCDVVTGSRPDLTIGPIKVDGYPMPEHNRVEHMIKKRIAKLHILEDELQEALNKVDDFIGQIPKSELRMMFRFYYLDDMTWPRVAMAMNDRFPKRKIKYTDDNCRKRHDRYLEEIYKMSGCVRF